MADWATKEATLCEYAVVESLCENGPGCCTGTTAPAGTHLAGASPYGVLDMAGNVSEWVQDYYDASYYDGSPTDAPMGPATGTSHTYRGGSFLSAGLTPIATSTRNPTPENQAAMGFRCALPTPAGAP